jgi:hypothetical protein
MYDWVIWLLRPLVVKAEASILQHTLLELVLVRGRCILIMTGGSCYGAESGKDNRLLVRLVVRSQPPVK